MLRTWAPRVSSPRPTPQPLTPLLEEGPINRSPRPPRSTSWSSPALGHAHLGRHPSLSPVLHHRPHDRVWTLKATAAPRSAVAHDHPGTPRPPQSCLPPAPPQLPSGRVWGRGRDFFSQPEGGLESRWVDERSLEGREVRVRVLEGRVRGHRAHTQAGVLGGLGWGGEGEAEGASDHSLPAD